MFANCLNLAIFWQRPRLDYMHPDNMQAAIFRSTSEAMRALQHTHALDPRMVLGIRMSRLARHAPLKPRGVPNLDGHVI